MKRRIMVLCLAVMSVPAFAGPFPGKITVGPSKQVVEPASSSIPGYRSFEFPVRVTNMLIRPVWFLGNFPDRPVYRIFMRAKDFEPWKDETMSLCGLGIQFQRIPPGQAIKFTVSVPARDEGKQFRIEIPLYESPQNLAPQNVITSDAVIVR